MCEHSVIHDYILCGKQPVIALRQCRACKWWTRVVGVEHEEEPPTPSKVLRDIAAWRMARQARERARTVPW